jgi:D-alanyl-D-alanine carboxypeptidase
MSYPNGKFSTVCYAYEPWHYRYFGRTVAVAIHRSGLTTRVWLWRHGTGG